MSNKRIDFSKTGGFPTTQNTLDFMQQAYVNAIQALADLAGNRVIISGMEENNNQVSDGWIVWDGELLPFTGGPKQTHILIEEETGSEIFEGDTAATEVYHTRKARFGGSTLLYSDLVRLDKIKVLQSNLNDLTLALNSHQENLGNPHEVTKDQVGLGNLPNEVGTHPLLYENHALASMEAVKRAYRVIYSGREFIYDVSGSGTKITVGHNAHLVAMLLEIENFTGEDYLVVGSIVSTKGDWRDDTNVIWTVRNKTENSFDLCLLERSGKVQDIEFEWALILK